MDLAKQIIVRYHADGHVRFQLPTALCASPLAERLVRELRRIEGVYRVDLSGRQRKLSIRFNAHFCDLDALKTALARFINPIEWAGSSADDAGGGTRVTQALRTFLKELHPVRWARGKLGEVRQTAKATGLLLKGQAVRERVSTLVTEDHVLQVLNDVLVLYLIRVHWPLIAGYWVRQPWRYRYDWMAVFYMVYLLVRSRRARG